MLVIKQRSANTGYANTKRQRIETGAKYTNAIFYYLYKGKKEDCTGGHDWYDCEGAQKDCVPTDTSF